MFDSWKAFIIFQKIINSPEETYSSYQESLADFLAAPQKTEMGRWVYHALKREMILRNLREGLIKPEEAFISFLKEPFTSMSNQRNKDQVNRQIMELFQYVPNEKFSDFELALKQITNNPEKKQKEYFGSLFSCISFSKLFLNGRFSFVENEEADALFEWIQTHCCKDDALYFALYGPSTSKIINYLLLNYDVKIMDQSEVSGRALIKLIVDPFFYKKLNSELQDKYFILINDLTKKGFTCAENFMNNFVSFVTALSFENNERYRKIATSYFQSYLFYLIQFPSIANSIKFDALDFLEYFSKNIAIVLKNSPQKNADFIISLLSTSLITYIEKSGIVKIKSETKEEDQLLLCKGFEEKRSRIIELADKLFIYLQNTCESSPSNERPVRIFIQLISKLEDLNGLEYSSLTNKNLLLEKLLSYLSTQVIIPPLLEAQFLINKLGDNLVRLIETNIIKDKKSIREQSILQINSLYVICKSLVSVISPILFYQALQQAETILSSLPSSNASFG
jgi:hypothetical protein